MQSFGISPVDGRIIEARWFSVSRADCVLANLAGGRDPANTTVSALASSPGGKRNGSYRRQEFT
ncbi:hypothetical protein [Paraburkholderia fynbosensis]|uniref:hypothetical protein n=1 Tax=Paraburkholderia fynbosensis TaxID=1200993 RepID=UPI000EB40407|nr:hypothetical protein [Paraburkholderia fynbosensis]